MRRIATLAILFVALVEFAIERARFDLWIVTAAAAALLWSIRARSPRLPVHSQKHDHPVLTSKK
jgi:hypothetical protein